MFPHQLFVDVATGLVPDVETAITVMHQAGHPLLWGSSCGALLY